MRLGRTTALAAWVITLGCGCSDPTSSDEAIVQAEETAQSEAISVPTSRPANPSCIAPERPPSALPVRLERVFPSLKFAQPVGIRRAPGNANVAYVVEKGGRVKAFDTTATTPTVRTWADVSSRVSASPNEAGLLGIAFHPQFAQNRQVYFSYTSPSSTAGGKIRSVLARLRARSGTNGPNAAPEELLTVDQPYENHNGGNIEFGPDGYLYMGLGDGGSGGDPKNNAQNKNVLLGKIVRLDVNGASPYAIPPTNPFARGGGRAEIYAYGLRNPWRFSFDRGTGELWAADVGQDRKEEVDKIVLGGNYGWRIKEATSCYNPSTNCNGQGLIDPVAEYGHDQGVSITGGYVYRGRAIPSLVGAYVFGDFGSGRIWALQPDAAGKLVPVLLVESGLNISSFAEAPDGELSVLDYSGGGIHTLKAATTTPGGTFPAKLSQTGCFDRTEPTKPVPALVPYEVNSPLWSDGAAKERFFAIPDSTQVTVAADGDWQFPNGTVLVKSFRVGARLVETRLFVRHTDGGWAGYTYAWDDALTDATLLDGALTRDLGNGTSWTYPSRAQCIQCHTGAAGGSLGLEDGQLNRTLPGADGGTDNQLALFERLGLVTRPTPGDPATLPKLPEPANASTPEAGARSYLHANCSFCHRPGGTGRGPADFRFNTPFAAVGVCNATPTTGDFGIVDARLFAPGAPERSMMSYRMHALGAGRMPPLASAVVDSNGVNLVDSWIRGTTTCPNP